ncbi:hypothetical protein C8R46DRAFT_419476 [Mycena filopes]|nr:hypothetical protein C8R46DRAFT_419476 [Mycena filopes]
MAFISNATNFTLGDGVYNNVHGSIIAHNHFHGLKRGREEIEDEAGASPLFIERAHKHRRLEGGAVEREPEAVKLAGVGFEIIDQEDLGLIHQIGHGPGYLLHAGRNKTKNRAITVKVFNSGPIARRKLELEVTLLKGLLHPNIPRLEGMSSSTSSSQFIAYKEFGWKQAKGPLATALQSRVRSIDLGFKMVADISAGLNYLSMQQLSMPAMKVEHFDVFLDIDDRFLILINPTSSDESDVPVSQAPQEDSSWALFNGLCHKLLVSANRILHNEGINRSPALLPPTLTLASSTSGSPSLSSQTVSSQDQQEDADFAAADPRREYIWRAMDRGDQSLATITDEMTANLDTVLGRLHRLTQTDGKNPHRCAGYVREEITLAPTVVESALVAHDTPTPLEICSVCHEVVGFQEKFRCICAASRPGLHTTIKCKVCKVWSHSRRRGGCHSSASITAIRYPMLNPIPTCDVRRRWNGNQT